LPFFSDFFDVAFLFSGNRANRYRYKGNATDCSVTVTVAPIHKGTVLTKSYSDYSDLESSRYTICTEFLDWTPPNSTNLPEAWANMTLKAANWDGLDAGDS
jgi:hypothetical protein